MRSWLICLGTGLSLGDAGCGLMVNALDSGSKGPSHLVVFLGKKDPLISQCLSPPRSINGYRRTVRET